MAIMKNGVRKQFECGRLYVDETGLPYGSVTGILDGFKPVKSTWVHDLAKVGTLCHLDITRRYKRPMIEEVLIWSIPECEVNAMRRNFRRMWKQLDITGVLDVEVPIVFKRDEFRYAGTLDLIYENDDQVIMADIKTGNMYDYYPLQLAAYYQAAKESFNIDRVVILHTDVSLDRNPLKQAKVIEYPVKAMNKYATEFNKMAVDYSKKLDNWLMRVDANGNEN